MSDKSIVLPTSTRLIDNAPLIVVSLLLIDSLHFVFARLLLPHLHPMSSAMYVLAIGMVEVAIFARIQGRISFTPFRRNMWFFLAVGFLVAVSTNLNYMSVAYIDPGTAALLSKATVVFGLGFGIVWMRDRLNRLQSVGAVLALIGVFVVTFQPGDYLRVGALMVVGSSFLYAVHAALVKQYGGKLTLTDFFLFRLTVTATFLFIFAAVGRHLVWPNTRTWLILLMVGTVDVVISRGLYYLALRQLKMSLFSLVLTISPVAAILWSLLLFGSNPTLQQMVGGVAVLAGVLMVSLRQSR